MGMHTARAGFVRVGVVVLACTAGCGDSTSSTSDPVVVETPSPTETSTGTPTSTPTPVRSPSLIEEGERLFFQEGFEGNGRTCGTCHPAAAAFTLSPAFIASLPADDPLFVAERVPELAGLESPALMHGPRALILENVDGFDQPPVFRGVPHVFDLAQTAPFGWSASLSTLDEFATRAVMQHFPRSLRRVAGVDFRLPTPHELAALAAFMQSVTLPTTESFDLSTLVSTPAEARGLELFFGNGKCTFCHSGPLFTDGGTIDTGVTRRPVNLVPPPECDPPCPPIGMLEAGATRAFNVPTLLGVADTAPFFHDNSAATLRDAVAHYTSAAFNGSFSGAFTGGIVLSDDDVDAITAFLQLLRVCGPGPTARDVGCEGVDGGP